MGILPALLIHLGFYRLFHFNGDIIENKIQPQNSVK